MYQRSYLPPLTPVVKNLMIANVLVFLAQLTFRQTSYPIEDMFVNHHALSPKFQLYQLITSVFMHADFGHLLSNMIGLYIFGSKLEDVWGPKRFFNFYIICGLAGSLLSTGVHFLESYKLISELNSAIKQPTIEGFNIICNKYGLLKYSDVNQVYTSWNANPGNASLISEAQQILEMIKSSKTSGTALGASGAIFGLIAGAAYLFPNDPVPFQFIIPIQIKWLALIYGFVTISSIANSTSDGIGHYAHLGGGIVGFCMVYFVYKKNRRNFY